MKHCTHTTRPTLTRSALSRYTHLCLVVALLCVSTLCGAAQQDANTQRILDRVIAVVNQDAILESDLNEELRLSVLHPGSETLDRKAALERIISRSLIEQQIHQEDASLADPAQTDVDARLHEIRVELPACLRAHCVSDEGWNKFLAAHQLTAPRVEDYMRRRLRILRFIEIRFRQGIRIAPAEVEQYYREQLLPQYAPGEQKPALDAVAPRIEEILLQQQVNALFDGWLRNLRKQGSVEVLDSSLEDAETHTEGARL